MGLKGNGEWRQNPEDVLPQLLLYCKTRICAARQGGKQTQEEHRRVDWDK
jgi:hypothetical protein